MHNSKKIIFLDHSNLSSEEYIRCVEQSLMDAKSHPSNEERLILIDATSSVMDKEVVKVIKEMTAEISGDISKVAVFGVSRIQLVFMRAIATFSKLNVRPFLDKQSAIEWLTK
jgi:SpoIIAA-like